MTKYPISNNTVLLLVFLVACLVCGGVVSVYLGQDANWDLKNYHIYNAWSLLNNRLKVDIFAAGIQTYFNPLLDLPYYFVAFEWFPKQPKVVAFIMGMPFGFLIFLTSMLASKVIKDAGIESYLSYFLVVVVVLIGLTGSATVSQVGTTFNEIQIATLIMGGLTVLAFGIKGANQRLSPFHIMAAGFIFGVAAGLKLTACIVAPAAALAIFSISSSWGRGVINMAIFSLFWFAAFLMVYGWWAYMVYDLTGNPVFPMFNKIFESSWIGHGSGMDFRFKPRSISETLFYPFYWIRPNTRLVTEVIFSDPRFAVGMSFIFAFILMLLVEKIPLVRKAVSQRKGKLLPPSSTLLLLFVIIAYITWQSVFSILRYTITIEALTGLVALTVLLAVKRIIPIVTKQLIVVTMLALLGIVSTLTTYPHWGRVAYGEDFLSITAVDLPDDSLIVFLRPPIAYVAPLLAAHAEGTKFVGTGPQALVAKKHLLYKNISKAVLNHEGDRFVVLRPRDKGLFHIIEDMGLSVLDRECQKFSTNIDRTILMCRLSRPY